MTKADLQNLINKLKRENEIPWIEVKVNLSDLNQIGKTVSALANSASWKNQEYGYFIFGLKNETWEVVGSSTKLENIKKGNEDGNLWLKKNGFSYKSDFEEYEFEIKGNRIYVIKIKNCENSPLYFLGTEESKSTAYIREAQNNDLLQNFPDRLKYICSKKLNYDWSAQICEGATIDDLDEEALEMARNGYLEKQKKLKNQSQIDIVAKIDLKKEPKKFLKYAKMLTKEGELSNSCMLLLGKDKTVVECGFAGEIGYVEKTFGVKEVYTVPFQKAIIKVVNKISIKNIELPIKLLGEYTGNNKLLPNYTPDLLREFVANCVAHQDYSKRSRIKVIETIHKSIELINEGVSLYSKQELEKFQIGNDIPDKYRNGALVNAMIEIGLMEAKGTGYNKLFQYNTKEVYLPLPKINWENTNQFEVKLYGAPLDKNFANILSQKTDLEPEVILVLDQVQKGFKMDKKIFNNLKRQGFVEGTPTKGILALNLEIMVSGVKAISKNNKRKEFDEEQCIKKIFSFIEACNKNSIQVKTSDIFDHIENDLTIREETEKKFNYLNNHIIKKMRNHPKYKIYSTKNGKSSSWLCII